MSAAEFQLDRRASYKTWTYDKLRFSDTDLVGHVNNAVFATFFETGRVSFLYDEAEPYAPPGADFVVVRLVIDFRAELRYPGTVDIGTRVIRIGRTSFTMGQGVFRNERCYASGEATCVLIDGKTRRPIPLPEDVRRRLGEL